MKSTEFYIRVRIASPDNDAIMRQLTAQLESIEGVVKVEWSLLAGSIEVNVHATFADGGVAKKLHRKITNIISRMPDLTIEALRTNVSEVFD